MPELPEVETIKEDLRQKVLNEKIVDVEVKKDKSVNYLVDSFVSALKGNALSDIERRGKLMVFKLKKEKKLPIKKEPITSVLVHLKMTGQLIYERAINNKVEVVAGGHKLTEKDFELPNKHTQIILKFDNGGQLFFNDLRRFGYMKLASDSDVEKVLSAYGIEPLNHEFTLEVFKKALGKRKLSIKAALMDQKKIAGIGNIYADEACFCAGILPMRRADTLSEEERKRLFSCIPKILKLAIKHRGTSFKDYRDSEGKKGKFTDFLNVYDREDKECRKCAGVVKKVQSSGRGTHYCPNCQK